MHKPPENTHIESRFTVYIKLEGEMHKQICTIRRMCMLTNKVCCHIRFDLCTCDSESSLFYCGIFRFLRWLGILQWDGTGPKTTTITTTIPNLPDLRHIRHFVLAWIANIQFVLAIDSKDRTHQNTNTQTQMGRERKMCSKAKWLRDENPSAVCMHPAECSRHPFWSHKYSSVNWNSHTLHQYSKIVLATARISGFRKFDFTVSLNESPRVNTFDMP